MTKLRHGDLVTWLRHVATTLPRNVKRAILVAVDVATVPISFWAAVAITVGPLPDATNLAHSLPLVALMSLSGGLLSILLGLPNIKLNAYEGRAMRNTALLAGTLAIWGYAVAAKWPAIMAPFFAAVPLSLPGGVFITFALVFVLTSIVGRIAMRNVLIWIYRIGVKRDRVLIYGAGQTGVQLARALRADHQADLIAFVDDNPTLTNMIVCGLPVHPATQVMDVVRRRKVDRIVLAMPSLSHPRLARLGRKLETLGCEVQTIPSFAQILDQGMPRPRRLQADLYLNRSQLDAELPGLSDTYTGRSVMVTGGGGSIGAELCRQVLLCRPATLVVFDVSEAALYKVMADLAAMLRRVPAEAGAEAILPAIVPVLGSVTDARAVTRAMRDHAIEVVLHAAAYKHVPMLEQNAVAGAHNNVVGTLTVAEAARLAGAARFVLVSTDKAVRPVGVLGASKRLAELVVQDLATRSETTRFGVVRFGNVLGSSGSVIPLFEEQIARGGPVTLTHPDITRYFMTVSEAARLVLTAGVFTCGGDVFVLDMGKPVPIRHLARQMIEGSGYTIRDAMNPDGDIEIEVTGLRPGEKLHEELLIGDAVLPTPHPKIMRAHEASLSEIEVRAAIAALRAAIEQGSEAAVRAAFARWVDGYGTASERTGRIGGSSAADGA